MGQVRTTALAVAALMLCSSAQADSGRWSSVDQKDRLDGSVSSFTWLGANEAKRYPHHQEPKDVLGRLFVVCKRSNIVVRFGVDGELVAGSTARIDYRIGSQPPVTGRRWKSSTDYSYTGLWDRKGSMPLLKAMASQPEMFIRITDDVFGVTEMTFDLAGLTDAFNVSQAQCGAKL